MSLEILMKYTERGNLTYFPSFLLFILFIYISFNVLKWIKRRKNLPPGPTGLPWVGYLPFLGSEPHKTIWKMKEKYGDIIGMRFGSRYTVVLNEYSVAKEVISHLGALDRPRDLFNHIPSLGFGDSNGEKWNEQRRFCLSVSRDLGLGRSSWEAVVMEEVHSFAEEIQKSEGTAIDISKALAHSVSSNIISLLIGRKLSKNEALKVQLFLDFADVAISYMGPSDPVTVMPGLRKLLEAFKIGGYGRAAKIIKEFQKYLKEEINRHKGSQEVDDFINSYLSKMKALDNNENKSQHYFSEKMLEGNVSVLFLGASDTITSSLNWVFRLMADYKTVQDKIYQELMDVIGRDGAAKYEERHKIPYTFAVLMESQRFSSIVPISTTRKATQDIPIRNYVIPKGTEIVVNLWGLHNDLKYWDEPSKFIPERFLTKDGSKLIKQPESYAPFSYGKRNCPGETVAWMEILAYFSHIVRNYEISFAPGLKPEYKILTGLVERLDPHPLCFKERN